VLRKQPLEGEGEAEGVALEDWEMDWDTVGEAEGVRRLLTVPEGELEEEAEAGTAQKSCRTLLELLSAIVRVTPAAL